MKESHIIVKTAMNKILVISFLVKKQHDLEKSFQ